MPSTLFFLNGAGTNCYTSPLSNDCRTKTLIQVGFILTSFIQRSQHIPYMVSLPPVQQKPGPCWQSLCSRFLLVRSCPKQVSIVVPDYNGQSKQLFRKKYVSALLEWSSILFKGLSKLS